MKNQQHLIYFRDGTKVSISTFVSVPEVSPIILLLPAMGVKASYYKKFAENLQKSELTTITADLRGLGLSSIRPSKTIDFGYLELIEDTKEIIEYIRRNYPDQKIMALGHSLGGQIAVLAQAKYNNLFDGIILTAANAVYYKGWDGLQQYLNLFAYNLFPLLSRIIGYFPGDKVGFGGKAAKTQVIDWGHVARNGYYKIIGDDLDYEKAMSELNLPVLAISIEEDLYSPQKAINHLLAKLNPTAPITKFTLTKQVTGAKLNHFNWVKHSKPIILAIKKWISF